MKKSLCVVCVCAIGLLSGCCGKFAGETGAGRDASKVLSGAAVSGHDVSGQAVSGQAVSGQSIQTDGEEPDSPEKDAGQKDLEKVLDRRYCTERYYYIVSGGGEEEEGDFYVVQFSLETGKRKEIAVEGICKLIKVERDALYYIVPNEPYDEDESYSLCRLPIERKKDGTEALRVNRREQVKNLEDIYYEDDDIYMDDQYIIYSGVGGDEEYKELICYDRKSGKKTSLPASSEVEDCLEDDIARIYCNDGRIDIVTTGGIVTWDVKAGEVAAVCEDKALDDYWPVSTENVCFYYIDGGKAILRMDMKTKKKTDFVSEEEFCAALEEATGLSKKQMNICTKAMYYDQNRLYIEMNIKYKKGGKTCHQDVMLSRKDTEGSPLQYERGITEYMWGDNGSNARASWQENNDVSRNWAECFTISRGKAYIRWFGSDESDEADEVVYDLKTKKERPAKAREMIMFEV